MAYTAGADVALVIGANDIVNPPALEDPGSPIHGMPVIRADTARRLVVLKRSMASGFAGIENDLFYRDNNNMLFGVVGDADHRDQAGGGCGGLRTAEATERGGYA